MVSIEEVKEMSGNELKVWLYLMLSQNERGMIFKSAEEVRNDLNLGYVLVYNTLKKFKEEGKIEVKGQKKSIKILN